MASSIQGTNAAVSATMPNTGEEEAAYFVDHTAAPLRLPIIKAAPSQPAASMRGLDQLFSNADNRGTGGQRFSAQDHPPAGPPAPPVTYLKNGSSVSSGLLCLTPKGGPHFAPAPGSATANQKCQPMPSDQTTQGHMTPEHARMEFPALDTLAQAVLKAFEALQEQDHLKDQNLHCE
jgi:hypothetical protein